MDGYVGLDAEKGGGAEPPEAVEPGEHLVEDDGETGPSFAVSCLAVSAEQMLALPNDFDERSLEKRVTAGCC